jgi:sporulation protein YlmC with PRC-barrel domain
MCGTWAVRSSSIVNEDISEDRHVKTNQLKSDRKQMMGGAFNQGDSKMKCVCAAVVLAALMLGLSAVVMHSALAQGTSEPPIGGGEVAANMEHVRASQVLGMTVWNEAGQKIASVDDLVIDTGNGRLGYVILAYREVLELGDRHFPVPWQAFTCQALEDGATRRLLLKASPETIRTAEGFAPGEWPDFDDRKFTRQLHAHYGVRPRRDARRGGVEARVGPGGVDVDVDP